MRTKEKLPQGCKGILARSKVSVWYRQWRDCPISGSVERSNREGDHRCWTRLERVASNARLDARAQAPPFPWCLWHRANVSVMEDGLLDLWNWNINYPLFPLWFCRIRLSFILYNNSVKMELSTRCVSPDAFLLCLPKLRNNNMYIRSYHYTDTLGLRPQYFRRLLIPIM